MNPAAERRQFRAELFEEFRDLSTDEKAALIADLWGSLEDEQTPRANWFFRAVGERVAKIKGARLGARLRKFLFGR